jgi:hypothetical protein
VYDSTPHSDSDIDEPTTSRVLETPDGRVVRAREAQVLEVGVILEVQH